MDELDPYRDMPVPSEEESSLLPSIDSLEHFASNSGMNGGLKELHSEMRPVGTDNGIGQGGHTMERRERGALSAQASFLHMGRPLCWGLSRCLKTACSRLVKDVLPPSTSTSIVLPRTSESSPSDRDTNPQKMRGYGVSSDAPLTSACACCFLPVTRTGKPFKRHSNNSIIND